MPRSAATTSPLPSLFGEAPRLSAGAAAVRSALLVGLALAALALAAPQQAQAQAAAAARSYSIPAGSLDQVLTRFASAAGAELSVDAALTRGKSSGGLNGSFTVQDGFAELLKGQGLQVVRGANGAYSLRAAAVADAAAAGGTLAAVTVTAAAERPVELPYAGGQVARGGRAGLLGDKSFMDTPFNITSYTAQTIQDQQARSVADVVLNDPSVRAVSPTSNGSEVFSIRGFPLNNQDVSFNGMYGILPFWRGSVASAERVEVLKGPSALLNGMSPSGAIGGSINVVPKRAGDIPLTQLTGTYISGSNFGTQLDVGRRFGPDNSVGIRVNGVYRDGDTNRTAQEHGEATVALDYRGESLRLSADLGYQKLQLDKVEGLLGLAAGAAVPAPPKAGQTYYQPWTNWKNDTTYGVIRAEVDLTPDMMAFAAFGARDFKDDYLFPFGFGLTAQGNFTEGFAYASSWYKSKSAEAGFRGRFSGGGIKHELNFAITDFRQDAGVLSGAAPTNASNIYSPTALARPNLAALANIRKTGETGLSSVAISDTISFAQDRVQLTVGLRRQSVKVDAFSAVNGAPTSSYDQSATTPSVGLVLKPAENVAIYGNYIEGLSQGPTAAVPASNVGQIFPPFKSKQYEAGIKFDFGQIATTFSVFNISRPSGLLNPATNIFNVDGEQRNRGLEFNVFGEVSKGVRLLGGAMLLDAKQVKTANGTFDGKYAVNSPKVELNLGGEWDLPSVPGLTLNARVLHTASAYVDAANTQSIPAWSRLDVGARYAFKAAKTPVVLRLGIENLLDRTYWMSSSLYRGNPRTVTLSATVDF